MNKISLMPQVNIYKNVISDEDIEFLLKEIKLSQNDYIEIPETDPDLSASDDYHGPQPKSKDDGGIIYTWTPWYSYGIRSIWSYPTDENNQNKNQVKGFKIIDEAIRRVHDDYMKDWAEKGRWTYDVKDWGLSEKINLSTYEILQHKIKTDKVYNIEVHTDWHNHRADEPGPKQLITYTIYLNDDYEGGEIDFVDEENEHVYVYKPRRGDITIFPSGQPFWHGARSVTSGNNKIFIRTFVMHFFPGTKEWIEGMLENGATRWVRMESEKVLKFIDEGNVGRQLVYPGQGVNVAKDSKPIFVKSESYIDGREIK